MKKMKIAAILMIIHGGLMELATAVVMIPLAMSTDIRFDAAKYIFAIDFFSENVQLMVAMGVIFGIVRVIGAVGLWKNRMWGLVLSVINCVVTMTVMLWMIPAGIMDGIFACSALILILTGYFGTQTAVKTK